MKAKLLGQTPANIYVLVFETGDSVIDGILEFLRESKLPSGFFYGVGACHNVTLGFFDHKRKDYLRTTVARNPANRKLQPHSRLLKPE